MEDKLWMLASEFDLAKGEEPVRASEGDSIRDLPDWEGCESMIKRFRPSQIQVS